jgi:hypothetical protein
LTIALHVNGTRKAKTNAKLGWHRLCPRSLALPISSLQIDGGDILCIEVVVQRVYQTLYCQQHDNRECVFRDSRSERAACREHDEKVEQEKETVLRALASHQHSSHWMNSRVTNGNIRHLDQMDDEGFLSAIMACNDPEAMAQSLSQEQRRRLDRVAEKQRQLSSLKMQSELQAGMQTQPRHVRECYRVHITDHSSRAANFSNHCDSCLLTVWEVADDVRRALKEGHRVRLFNINGGSRNNSSCFNYRRASRVEVVACASVHPAYVPRCYTKLCNLSQCTAGAQIDFCGVLLSLSHAAASRAHSKGHVFLIDRSATIVCLQMWQFQHSLPLGKSKHRSSANGTKHSLVFIRDGFYGGHDIRGSATHLCYCTEDTAVNVSAAQYTHGRGKTSSLDHDRRDLSQWCNDPKTKSIIEHLEDQLSSRICPGVAVKPERSAGGVAATRDVFGSGVVGDDDGGIADAALLALHIPGVLC